MTWAERLRTQWREVAVGVLAALVVLLGAALLVFPASPGLGGMTGSTTGVEGRIDSAIGSVLGHFEIEPASGRMAKWVQLQGIAPRREMRLIVAAGFPSLLLNHALATAVQPFGAHVIGVENSIEKRVALHVRKDGQILRTVILQESNEQH